jgi:hypothetical protein
MDNSRPHLQRSPKVNFSGILAFLSTYARKGITVNLIDVTQELGTDEQCFAFLEKQRWPDGVECPSCGCVRISRIERRSESKNVRKSLYQCLGAGCRQQFSVTSGTIFQVLSEICVDGVWGS